MKVKAEEFYRGWGATSSVRAHDRSLRHTWSCLWAPTVCSWDAVFTTYVGRGFFRYVLCKEAETSAPFYINYRS